MLKHTFQSAKSDGADATLIRPGNWNREHTWDGGADKGILSRDTAAADGASWMTVDSTLQITGASGSRVLGAIGFPAGTVVAYGAAAAPSGWLLCDGAAVSRATYATLFGVIGTTFGVGDGATTFNVPNLKGRVPVGLDAGQTEFDALAEAGGAKTHTLTEAEMPAHSHTIAYSDQAVALTGGNTPLESGGSTPTSTVGGGEAHNNLQPYLVLNYLIKT